MIKILFVFSQNDEHGRHFKKHPVLTTGARPRRGAVRAVAEAIRGALDSSTKRGQCMKTCKALPHLFLCQCFAPGAPLTPLLGT